MTTFQACTNAAQSRCHLRDASVTVRPQLTLCAATAVAFNYKAPLALNLLCKNCLSVYKTQGGEMPPTAASLGVMELRCD